MPILQASQVIYRVRDQDLNAGVSADGTGGRESSKRSLPAVVNDLGEN